MNDNRGAKTMYYFRNGKRKSDDARANGNPAGRRDGIFGQMTFKATDDHNFSIQAMEGLVQYGA
jgi:hypothetical protein